MDSPIDILISVEERHACNILAGNKTVELRRKKINVSSGTRMWIYSKLPCGQIQGIATVDKVITMAPKDIWRLFGARSAISKLEFEEYFANKDIGHAIVLNEVRALTPMLDLAEIRKRISHFQPPQFFKKLSQGSPELALFQTAL